MMYTFIITAYSGILIKNYAEHAYFLSIEILLFCGYSMVMSNSLAGFSNFHTERNEIATHMKYSNVNHLNLHRFK